MYGTIFFYSQSGKTFSVIQATSHISLKFRSFLLCCFSFYQMLDVSTLVCMYVQKLYFARHSLLVNVVGLGAVVSLLVALHPLSVVALLSVCK